MARTAKQMGNQALVTETYEYFPTEGDKVTFTYCGELREGTVESMRPSTVNRGYLVFTDNGMVDTTFDKVYKVKQYFVKWNEWVLGQMLESGVLTVQEVLAEMGQ